MRRLEALAYRTARVALPTGNAALAAYVRDQDARLLHFHFLTDARFMAGVHRRTGLPALVSGYGYDVSWFPLQWHGLGRRYLLPVFDRVDCVLAMSDDMRRDICALGLPRTQGARALLRRGHRPLPASGARLRDGRPARDPPHGPA